MWLAIAKPIISEIETQQDARNRWKSNSEITILMYSPTAASLTTPINSPSVLDKDFYNRYQKVIKDGFYDIFVD